MDDATVQAALAVDEHRELLPLIYERCRRALPPACYAQLAIRVLHPETWSVNISIFQFRFEALGGFLVYLYGIDVPKIRNDERRRQMLWNLSKTIAAGTCPVLHACWSGFAASIAAGVLGMAVPEQKLVCGHYARRQHAGDNLAWCDICHAYVAIEKASCS